MARLPILEYPDPRLRIRAEPVTKFDTELKTLVADMFETMYAAPGIGLAATQVNVHKRILVCDLGVDSKQPYCLINPEIIRAEGKTNAEEGCLSVPEFYDFVDRAAVIRVRAFDPDGKPFELDAEGMLAVCIQHEMDHLDGKLFVDYLSELKRERLKKKAVEESEARRGRRGGCACAQVRARDLTRRGGRSLHAHARIAFAGTPDFAVPSLRAIVATGATVPLVLTQPDRPAGRGRRLTASPVKELAVELGLAARAAGDAARAERDCRARASGPISWSSSPMGCCCRARCSSGRGSAASTCTPRCCRAGAVRRRSNAPCSPATRRPASASCKWTPGSTRGPCTSRARRRSARTRRPARCTTGSPSLAAETLLAALPARAGGHLRRRTPQRSDARDRRAEDRESRGAARLARAAPCSSSGACAPSTRGPSPRRA